MKQTFKIANWELKRNLKNKSFLISLFLTPALMALFIFIPSLFDDTDEETATIQVIVADDLDLFPQLTAIVDAYDLVHWELIKTELDEAEVIEQLKEEENLAYLALDDSVLADHSLTIYTSDIMDDDFFYMTHMFTDLLKQYQLEQLSLTEEELAVISQDIALDFMDATETTEDEESWLGTGDILDPDRELFLRRAVPGLFSGIILFSIVISGMMIFQSASQEKKDKMAEIILSSVTPTELMQGKIIGYFFLGIIQVAVWLGLAIPVVLWKVDLPILKYLLVPELALLLTIAILGYLVFASIFVGIGATIEDVSTSGNFQGLVFMLPFLPIMLIGPVISDPSGIIAKVASYIPFTSPGILLVRLTILDEWPRLEIAISIAILLLSVWLLMKLAGKIFQTAILLYGKNASPREIWRWLWM